MRNNKHFNQGFTLIEVMAAVAVFAVSAIGLFSINNQTVLVAEQLETKTFAHWIAMNTLVLLEAKEDLPNAGDETDTEEMAGQEWIVMTLVEETALDTVRRVTVIVSQEMLGDKTEQARLVGFVGKRNIGLIP